ncbi:hypothetical protein ACQKM9_15710 [Viridibacillus sp. NPDC093762]|uniref:hypothetical protein n=1 Tax=Viridibacillus sp. NPDC093762 TaxID=3390720 RepID=UPI003D04EAD1
MIKHVIKLFVKTHWVRLIATFVLIGTVTFIFEPVYLLSSESMSWNDWFLEMSGSLIVMYIVAPFSVALITFDVTKWLWSNFGIYTMMRLQKRQQLFSAYTLLMVMVVSYIIFSILFWTVIIGLFKFDLVTVTNYHPFFESGNSPILIIGLRFLLDWWALLFIASLSLLGSFYGKSTLVAFGCSIVFPIFLAIAFKTNITGKGYIPGAAMQLAIHEEGTSLLLLTILNELYVLILLLIIYSMIRTTNLSIGRTKK